tara:strand:- start:26040 stop:26585 length:546 start_codon:yes stop_codon:yes gene_type:complete
MSNNIFIKGERLYLRPLNIDDLNGNYRYWLNDPEVVKHNSHGKFPMTENMLKNYILQTTKDESKLVLAIIELESNKHIGNISLQQINYIDRNCEIAFLLGDKDFWSKGIMFEAGKLLISHAFRHLNLHRIYCATSSNNIGMQKLATKLGMKKEGVRVDGIFNQGKYFDIFEYGLINKYEIL